MIDKDWIAQYQNEQIFPYKIYAWDPGIVGDPKTEITKFSKKITMPRELQRDIRVKNPGILQFTPDLILNLLQVPDIIRVHGHEGIHYDFDSNTFKVKVRHESFPRVRDGEVIPVISPGMLLIDKCKECKNPKVNYDFSFALDNQYDAAYIMASRLKQPNRGL